MATAWIDRAPDAVFDLHGQSVLEARANAEHFLRAQARVRGLLRAQRESGGVVADYFLEETEGSFLIRLR
jgi:DNA-nicking Smr family endonuclease